MYFHMFLLQLLFLLLMKYIGLFSDPKINSDKENHEIVKRHISSPASGYINVFLKYAKKNINVKKHEGKQDHVKPNLETLYHQVDLIELNHGVMLKYQIL